ncbi:hypothetical protein PMZ80_009253 [Knufia obscura]|uniref:F-box domain-containing protein n=1 Tax=Knufia obscura TaxID=1635080 RepID=A0ABR0RDF0_9EURO|nr:hypothetical protein PMZ80_009253 [Knufia obscura]
MVALLDLPEELLLLIIKALRNSWAPNTLIDLAVVNKRFTPLVRIALAHHASIYVASDNSANRPKHLTQFLEFLRNHPEVLNCLDCVDLGWDRKRFSKSYNDALTILAKSESLRRLSLSLASQAQFAKVPILFQPPPGSFCNVEWIDVDVDSRGDLAADHVVKLCELPSIRRISNMTSNITACSSPHMLEAPEQYFKCTPLKLRRLESLAPMTHMDYLKLVLPRCKDLDALHISLPCPGVRQETQSPTSRFPSRLDTDHKFSPREIEKYVRYATRTLERLSITSMRDGPYNWDATFIHPGEHDNSYLDVSLFWKLYYIKVSSYLLFGNHGSAKVEHISEGRPIWELLPRSLEELTINFEGHQGIFTSLDEMCDNFLEWDEDFVDWWAEEVARHFKDVNQLGWLYDLVKQAAAGHFPNLHEIVLEECYPSLWGKWKLIDIAQLHPELTKHDFKVAIRVMVPEEMAEDCIKALREFGFTGGVDTSLEDAVYADLVARGLIKPKTDAEPASSTQAESDSQMVHERLAASSAVQVMNEI